MATYITTVKFTEQGIKAVNESTRRAAAIKALAKKMKVKVGNIFWTLGNYDGLLTFDAPDEETATAWLLSVGAQGNVRTTTVRAFSASEMDKIVAKMSG
jgi:uncharacterized protein with GYD domain